MNRVLSSVGLIGLLIALVLETQVIFEHSLPLLALLSIAGFFALFGAWSGGLAGVTRENYKIRRFHSDLEKGKYLIMVDVLKNQEQLIRQQLSQYHPEALLAAEGTSLIHPFCYKLLGDTQAASPLNTRTPLSSGSHQVFI